nr:MAG TPA: hypothetical protein [Caudoviricetes sp.]
MQHKWRKRWVFNAEIWRGKTRLCNILQHGCYDNWLYIMIMRKHKGVRIPYAPPKSEKARKCRCGLHFRAFPLFMRGSGRLFFAGALYFVPLIISDFRKMLHIQKVMQHGCNIKKPHGGDGEGIGVFVYVWTNRKKTSRWARER